MGDRLKRESLQLGARRLGRIVGDDFARRDETAAQTTQGKAARSRTNAMESVARTARHGTAISRWARHLPIFCHGMGRLVSEARHDGEERVARLSMVCVRELIALLGDFATSLADSTSARASSNPSESRERTIPGSYAVEWARSQRSAGHLHAVVTWSSAVNGALQAIATKLRGPLAEAAAEAAADSERGGDSMSVTPQISAAYGTNVQLAVAREALQGLVECLSELSGTSSRSLVRPLQEQSDDLERESAGIEKRHGTAAGFVSMAASQVASQRVKESQAQGDLQTAKGEAEKLKGGKKYRDYPEIVVEVTCFDIGSEIKFVSNNKLMTKMGRHAFVKRCGESLTGRGLKHGHQLLNVGEEDVANLSYKQIMKTIEGQSKLSAVLSLRFGSKNGHKIDQLVLRAGGIELEAAQVARSMEEAARTAEEATAVLTDINEKAAEKLWQVRRDEAALLCMRVCVRVDVGKTYVSQSF